MAKCKCRHCTYGTADGVALQDVTKTGGGGYLSAHPLTACSWFGLHAVQRCCCLPKIEERAEQQYECHHATLVRVPSRLTPCAGYRPPPPCLGSRAADFVCPDTAASLFFPPRKTQHTIALIPPPFPRRFLYFYSNITRSVCSYVATLLPSVLGCGHRRGASAREGARTAALLLCTAS